MGDNAPVLNKTVIIVIAFAVIAALVITTPGWKDVFGLAGIKFGDQFLTYGLIAAGIIGMIVFAMNSSSGGGEKK